MALTMRRLRPKWRLPSGESGLRLRLTVDVTYEREGATIQLLKDLLEHAAHELANSGVPTCDADAEIRDYKVTVEDITPSEEDLESDSVPDPVFAWLTDHFLEGLRDCQTTADIYCLMLLMEKTFMTEKDKQLIRNAAEQKAARLAAEYDEARMKQEDNLEVHTEDVPGSVRVSVVGACHAEADGRSVHHEVLPDQEGGV